MKKTAFAIYLGLVMVIGAGGTLYGYLTAKAQSGEDACTYWCDQHVMGFSILEYTACYEVCYQYWRDALQGICPINPAMPGAGEVDIPPTRAPQPPHGDSM